MLFNAHTSFLISDRSYMSNARREISKIASTMEFSDEQKGKIDIIISELTSNLIKHNAVNGEILVKQIEENNCKGLEIISVDNGPGMAHPQRMMEDGVSTYGSKGEGLGAIKRLSNVFDLYSQPAIGTFILSRLFTKVDNTNIVLIPSKINMDVKVVMVPKAGEKVCGDGFSVIHLDNQISIFALDGLGHGSDANIASQEAATVFKTCNRNSPSEVLKIVHNTIRKTRGVVAGLANIDFKTDTVAYCGIGNIAAKIIYPEGSKNLISYNGTVGHIIPNTLNNHFFNWQKSSTLVLHSDGLKARWDFSKYPGIEKHDTSLIAAVLYKDNTRIIDDAMVLVARN